MEFLAITALLMLLSGATMYLLVCIDPNNPGVLGMLHRFVYNKVPALLRKVLGDRILDFFGGIVNYVFYTNHPLVQFFYILVAVGGFIVYCIYGFLTIFYDNPRVTHLHSLIGCAFAFYSFYSYAQACYYSSGIIHKKNVDSYNKEFQQYYDGVMYQPDNFCKTCNIIKPARSKHCRICNLCVSRFDHHCIWIRQCVGQNNYQYFLKFIALHAILCNYGTYIGVLALLGVADKHNLFKATFRNPVTKEILEASYLIVFKYLFYTETMFIFITLLCLVMGFTLTLFLVYHLSMVRAGTTTNEKMKRSDFQEYFTREIDNLQKIVKTEINPDKLESAKKKLNHYEISLQRLFKPSYPGLIKGLKDVFSQKSEIKWVALRNHKKAQSE